MFHQNEKSISNQCTEIYKNCLNLVQNCRENPNEIFIQQCISQYNAAIETLKHIRNNVAKSGGQKQSCRFTINLIQSLRDDLKSIIIKKKVVI